MTFTKEVERMKKMRVVILLGAFLIGLGAAAYGLSLCDYHSPVTALTDADLSFTYRYYNDAATPAIDVNSGRVGIAYDQLYDSPNYGFSLAGSGGVTLVQFLPVSWLGQGAATFRYYPVEDGLFFAFGGLKGSMATGQPRPGVEVSVGGGVGRFTDVTPLSKAFLIQKELLALEAIDQNLSDDVLLGIASVIGRAAEYDTVKEMVSDIEGAIEAAAGVTLDARAILSIEEIILQTGNERKCGWALQGGIGYELIDPYGGAQNFVVTGSADAALASCPSDQLLFHASFSGPLDFANENTLTAKLSYEHLISDKSTLIAEYSLQRVKPAGLPVNVSHAAMLSLGFNLGGADVVLQFSLTRDPGNPGWSIDVSVSAAMDLL